MPFFKRVLISSLQYSIISWFIWMGLALVVIALSMNPSMQGKETICFFLFQKALGKSEQISFSNFSWRFAIWLTISGVFRICSIFLIRISSFKKVRCWESLFILKTVFSLTKSLSSWERVFTKGKRRSFPNILVEMPSSEVK